MWQLYCPRYTNGNMARGAGARGIGLHKFAPAPNALLLALLSYSLFLLSSSSFFFLWASQICRILLCCRLYGVIFCGHKYTPKMLMTAKRGGRGRDRKRRAGKQTKRDGTLCVCEREVERVGGQIHGQIVWQFALVLYFNLSQKTSIDKCFGRTVGQAAHHMSNCKDLDEYS